MTMLQRVQELLPEMTPAEKAQVLQWIARDLGGAFPGIESIGRRTLYCPYAYSDMGIGAS
jgi:hypothetical protein